MAAVEVLQLQVAALHPLPIIQNVYPYGPSGSRAQQQRQLLDHRSWYGSCALGFLNAHQWKLTYSLIRQGVRCHRLLGWSVVRLHMELICRLTVRLEHPGGSRIILKYAGKDATCVFQHFYHMTISLPFLSYSEAYEPIHPPDAITTNLPTDKQYVVCPNGVHTH